MKKLSSRLMAGLKGKSRNLNRGTGRVEGKVAIVTGAAQGLGKAIASVLAREGAKVMLTDIDEPRIAAVADEICASGGVASFMQQDVSDETLWTQVVKKTSELYGGLNILINNAGIAKLSDVDNFNPDELRRMFSVNLEGTYFGMISAIAVMKSTGGGSIVNISSVGSMVALPGLASYCASKGAIRQLTKSIALECTAKKYAIRVNSLHPGFVPTPNAISDVMKLTGLSKQGAIDEIATTIPVGRPGTPEEIAYGALFLASDESSFMTGSELVMDGGVSAA